MLLNVKDESLAIFVLSLHQTKQIKQNIQGFCQMQNIAQHIVLFPTFS